MKVFISVALLSVLILYWALTVLFQSDRKFRSQGYTTSQKASWKLVADYLETFAKKRVKVSNQQHEKLAKMLYRVGWTETPEDIVAQQVMFGGLVMIGISLFAIVTNEPVFFFVALVLGVMFYRFPLSRLKKAIREKEELATQELPDFIDLLILLFSAGLTPYESIKNATAQASPGLKLDADRLAKDIDAMSDAQALDRFAENLGIRPAQRFVFAMKQAMEMSKKEAQDIFKSQAELMREMRVQNIRRIIKLRPAKVQMISWGVFGFALIVPVSIIALSFVNILKSVQ
jgi:Flp pilus assembly protein TadB